MTETRYIEIPRGVKSASGRTIAFGFPDGLPIPENVQVCGDGLHVFKPLTWDDLDDAICVCGTVVAGYPILMLPADGTETILMLPADGTETILMLDAAVSHAECDHDD